MLFAIVFVNLLLLSSYNSFEIDPDEFKDVQFVSDLNNQRDPLHGKEKKIVDMSLIYKNWDKLMPVNDFEQWTEHQIKIDLPILRPHRVTIENEVAKNDDGYSETLRIIKAARVLVLLVGLLIALIIPCIKKYRQRRSNQQTNATNLV